jgi:hypothetical protein
LRENTFILIVENEQDYTYVLERWDDGILAKSARCTNALQTLETLVSWVRIYGGATVEWSASGSTVEWSASGFPLLTEEI